MKKTIPTVAAYIQASPSWAKITLKEIRTAIRAAAPEAIESISYKMPYYNHNGRLAYFAVFKSHCSFFWITASDKKIFAKELVRHKVVGSTLQIPMGSKVPVGIIKKIVHARLKANQAKKNLKK